MIAIGEEWFGNPDAIIEPVNGNKYRWATNGVIFPIQNIQYGHPVFQKLITNPKIIRVIASFTFNSPRSGPPKLDSELSYKFCIN